MVSVLFLPEQVREVRCCFLENTWVKETDHHSGTSREGPSKRPGEESLTSNPVSMCPFVERCQGRFCDFLYRTFTELTELLLKQTKYVFIDSLSALATPVAQSGIWHLGKCYDYGH
jgi:hypothetical protein